MGASPQLENGYTKVADELLEAIAAARLSGEELRIILATIRKTYGFKKKMDIISLRQFQDLTGIPRKRCHRVLNQLVDKKVILKGSDGKKIEYGVQKDYTLWLVSPRRGTGSTVPQIGDRVSPRRGTKVSPRRGTTIKNYIETSQERGRKRPFPPDSWQVKLAQNFHSQLVGNGNLPSKLSKSWEQEWAAELDKLHRLDGEPLEEIRATVLWPQTQKPKPGSDFCWAHNFTTLRKLRRRLKSNPDETYYGLFKQERRRSGGRRDGATPGSIAPDDSYSHLYQ